VIEVVRFTCGGSFESMKRFVVNHFYQFEGVAARATRCPTIDLSEQSSAPFADTYLHMESG
jgi:hypothetical protein